MDITTVDNMSQESSEPIHNNRIGNLLLYATIIGNIIANLICFLMVNDPIKYVEVYDDLKKQPEAYISYSNLTIISRSEWKSEQPLKRANKLIIPVHYVIILQTLTNNCSNETECTSLTKYIQNIHVERKRWWDIGYNFLVGGDGFVYEGRGWEVEGTHNYHYNAKSLGIAFIGTFNIKKPPEEQIIAAQKLIQKGIDLGYIANDYTLFAKLQQGKRCSGLALLNSIKSWRNWNQKLTDCQ